jgi:alpha-1,2-mannosyltransferase
MPVAERRGPPVAGVWLAVALAAAVQVWAGFTRTSGRLLADLHVYLGSIETWYAGGSLYDFAAQDTGAPFTYPPFAALVLAPLPLLPFAIVAALWTLATLAAVLAVAALAADRTRIRAGLIALALVLSAPVASNLRFGQVSIFLAGAVLIDVLHVVPPRYRGIATGIAGAVKLTPLIFVPYFWLSGQRRTAVSATVSFAAAGLLGWIVLPAESARYWFTVVWNVDRVGNIVTGGNQSLNGALLRWGAEGATRTAAVALLGAAVVVVALRRAVLAGRAGHHLTAAVLVGAAGLVLSPVSWTHHQIWLVLAAFLTVGARPGTDLAWTALVLAVMILPATGFADPYVLGNLRLWLAVAVAVAVPFSALRAAPSPARVTAS